MRIQSTTAVAALVLFGSIMSASRVPAQTTATPPTPSMLQTLQVTATRFGEPIEEVPGAISVVTGENLHARGATDLRTALALLGGVSVAPGGDAGPASAVPGLLGVREVDDLLLLIDGIPAGGAFIPQVEAVSLNNVDRIEVLRGAAPVYFGTTAFAGTINVIHSPAGSAESELSLRYGSYGSIGASGSAVLSKGAVQQSVSGEWSDDKLSDRRAGYKRAQGSWRLATELGAGRARADVNVIALRQKPNSPTAVDTATGRLTTLLPIDFNQNPVNARLDTDRYQLLLGYDLPVSIGSWGTTLTYTETQNDSVRGFIDLGDTPQPWTVKTNADLESFKQSLHLRELFADSHLTTQLRPGLDLTTGVNLLLGRAGADSLRYGLKLLLDGVSQAPNIESVSPKGSVDFNDHRSFLGVYGQSRFKLAPTASLLAGLRWNQTHETRDETRVSSRGVVTTAATGQDINRLSGSLGAQWKFWQSPAAPINSLGLHASVGGTFQPAQIDFGPDPETQPEGGGLLKPESQRSVVFGLKADAAGGLAEFDVDGFIVDFNNQPVQATSASGAAVLRAIGEQRYKGVDVEGALHPATSWTVKATVTLSDARYRDFVTDVNGKQTQLAGKRQVLTPTWRAGTGIIFTPERGWHGSLTSSWIGRHWLNSSNTFEAPGYAILDASLGYRFKKFSLQISAENLGDRRDAVQLSELGEGQFYRMSGRRFDFTVTIPFR